MDMQHISQASAETIRIFSKLTEAQLLHYYEPESGLFIAEGALVMERALHAGYEPVTVVATTERLETRDKELLARCENIPIYTGSAEELTEIFGFKVIRGPFCLMRRKPLPSPMEICANAKRIAVLERITNPTNVGAIIRSAAALGMDAVLLSGGCADPFYQRAQRTSMGTVFQIPWTYQGKNALTDMEQLQAMGFRTAAMALKSDSVSLRDLQVQPDERIAILLGEEGYGLCDATIEKADATVLIPMTAGIDSLNVAAASAVTFWQLGNLQ